MCYAKRYAYFFLTHVTINGTTTYKKKKVLRKALRTNIRFFVPKRSLWFVRTKALFTPNRRSVSLKRNVCFISCPNKLYLRIKKNILSSILHPTTPANRTEHALLHTHENRHIFAGNKKKRSTYEKI